MDSPCTPLIVWTSCRDQWKSRGNWKALSVSLIAQQVMEPVSHASDFRCTLCRGMQLFQLDLRMHNLHTCDTSPECLQWGTILWPTTQLQHVVCSTLAISVTPLHLKAVAVSQHMGGSQSSDPMPYHSQTTKPYICQRRDTFSWQERDKCVRIWREQWHHTILFEGVFLFTNNVGKYHSGSHYEKKNIVLYLKQELK